MSAPSPALASVPFPGRGEHPAGYSQRLVEANGLPSFRQMRATHGFGALSPLSGDETWRLVRSATGLDEAFLRRLAWHRVQGGKGRWLDVCGSPVRLRDLELKTMRHCPSCLNEDRLLRVEWSIRQFAACPIHACTLVDACLACGRRLDLDDRRDLFTCGACGTGVLDHASPTASPEAVAIATALEAAIGLRPQACSPPDLPPEFLALAPGAMAGVVERLMAVSALASAMAHEETMRTVHALLVGWPESYHATLGDLVEDAPAPGGGARAHFRSPAGRLAIRALKDHEGRTVDFLHEPVRDFLRDGLGIEPRRRAPGSKARSDGRATTPAAAFAAISHASAMERLEGSADEKRAKWWIRAGLIEERRIRPGEAVLSLEDVGCLRLRLQAITGDGDFPAPVDLVRIDRSFTAGREYRKDRFLLDLLDGRIRCRRADERPGLAGLRFHAGDLERLRGAARVRNWIASDAHVALGVFNSCATAIWGGDAAIPIERWNGLVEDRKVSFVLYHPPTPGARPQKRWRVADLVRHLQGSGLPELGGDRSI